MGGGGRGGGKEEGEGEGCHRRTDGVEQVSRGGGGRGGRKGCVTQAVTRGGRPGEDCNGVLGLRALRAPYRKAGAASGPGARRPPTA